MSYLPTRPPEMRLDSGDTPEPPAEGASPSALPLSRGDGIRAIAFDCYGTLIDFTDSRFIEAYHEIARNQRLPCDGKTLWQKYMAVWRRLSAWGKASETPRDWSIQPPSGETVAFRPYSDEWTEYFQMCFDELGVQGNPFAAYEHVRDRLATADPFEETASVLTALRSRYHVGMLSNADDDFLFACLERNGLQDEFEVIVTSEGAGAYKPHEAIFRRFAEAMGAEMHEVLYVGDSQSADVLGARNAGMPVAWVNRDGAPLREGVPRPDHEIASLTGLLQFLL